MERMVYNVSEVAEILQTTDRVVRHQIRIGRLPAFKLGKILIRREDLEGYLKASVGWDVYPDEPLEMEI